MKRSVAIHGSTPPFVRWAISHPCSLRTLESANLTDQTFRQLRGVREYSVGLQERRVFEGVCFHPSSSSEAPQLARGFVDREVLDAFGDESNIRNACTSCPANAMVGHRPGVWAGCYGWIPESPDFSFETVLRGQKTPPQHDDSPEAGRVGASCGMTDRVETAFDQLVADDPGFLGNAEDLFPLTTPRWYGFWQSQQLTVPQTILLRRLFEQVVEGWDTMEPGVRCPSHLIQFRNALRNCEQHQLVMFVDLVPAGYSDGSTWTLESHCPVCKLAADPAIKQPTRCTACQRFGNPHGPQKNKVLGLRPYVLVSRFLGEQNTAEILKRYELWKKRDDRSPLSG